MMLQAILNATVVSRSEKARNRDVRRPFWTPLRIARMAIFIALSYIGALIKIPSPTGTVAMDSCPGYFSALAWGYIEGAIVISLGHIFTAASVGFPLGLPMHLLIAIQMALWAMVLRFLAHKVHWIAGIIVTAFCNSVVSGAVAGMIISWGLFWAILPSLIFASFINIVVATVAWLTIKKNAASLLEM